MDRDKSDNTLDELAIRELERSVSLCTLCELETKYLFPETQSSYSVPLSLIELSSTDDSLSETSFVTAESPVKNDYLATLIDIPQYKSILYDREFPTFGLNAVTPVQIYNKSQVLNDGDVSCSFLEFLNKTAKQVPAKLSNICWDDVSWDKSDEKQEEENPLSKEISVEFEISEKALESDKNKKEFEETGESNKVFEKIITPRTPPRNFDSNIRDDVIPRKRSKISLKARRIFDTPEHKEFAECFMKNPISRELFVEDFRKYSESLELENINKRSTDQMKASTISLLEETNFRKKTKTDYENLLPIRNELQSINLENVGENCAQSFSDTEIRNKLERFLNEVSPVEIQQTLPEKWNLMQNCTQSFLDEEIHRNKNAENELSEKKSFLDEELRKKLDNFLNEVSPAEIQQKRPEKCNLIQNCTQSFLGGQIRRKTKIGEESLQFPLICDKQTVDLPDRPDVAENFVDEKKIDKITAAKSSPETETQFDVKKSEDIQQFPVKNKEIREQSQMEIERVSRSLVKRSTEVAKIREIISKPEANYTTTVDEALNEEIPRKKPKIVAVEILAPSLHIPLNFRPGQSNDPKIPFNDQTPCKYDEEMLCEDDAIISMEIPIASRIEKLPKTEHSINKVPTLPQSIVEDRNEQKLIDNFSLNKNIEKSDTGPDDSKTNKDEGEEEQKKLEIFADKIQPEFGLEGARKNKRNQNVDVSNNEPEEEKEAKVSKSWKGVKKEFAVPNDKRRRRTSSYRPLTSGKSPPSSNLQIVRAAVTKRRTLMNDAINRLRNLSCYMGEVRNIVSKDAKKYTIVKPSAKSSHGRMKILVSTSTQTGDFGSNSPKRVPRSSVNFAETPKHEIDKIDKNDDRTDASASGENRSNNLQQLPVVVEVANNQNNQPEIELQVRDQRSPKRFSFTKENENSADPKASGSGTHPLDNFPQLPVNVAATSNRNYQPHIEHDMHTYNPLRPQPKRIRKIVPKKKSTTKTHQSLFLNRLM